MRWTGLRVTPVAGSEMTAPKLSTPICIFVTPDIRGTSELEGPYESISPVLSSNSRPPSKNSYWQRRYLLPSV
jgi:hypothetical protein